MKIALVEDNIELNKIITKTLKKENFEVDSFFDTKELLKSNLNYDLYLIDINLPKINGIDLIDLINEK
ncbi:MAG: response regulator, partial [Nautiliaceae bacterium]